MQVVESHTTNDSQLALYFFITNNKSLLMPTVSHENIDHLNLVLTIEVSPEDYLKKVNAKLKEIRQTAQIKGFRPGKTPETFVKRKFGNSILAEEISKILDESISDYIKSQKFHLLGAPMESADSNIRFDINTLDKYVFKFDLGITPDFEIKGLSQDIKLPYYEIVIDDEKTNHEVEEIRKKYGNGFQEGVKDIIETDMIVIDLHELDADGNLKENGVVKEGTYLALRDTTPALKADLLTATLEDHFDVNVFEMENNRTTEYVRKHVLGIDPNQVINDKFRLTIKEIKRIEKAELNEEFFKKIFPNDEITNEEEFSAKIKEELTEGYKNRSKGFFADIVFTHLLEQNQLEMPIDFLKRWLNTTEKQITPDYFEPNGGFDDLLRSTRWTLIREKLAKQFDIEVTMEDLKNSVRFEILRYFNYQIPPYGDMIDNIINNVLKDKKEVQRRYDSLVSNKTLDAAANYVGTDTKEVSVDEFNDIVADFNKKHELVEA